MSLGYIQDQNVLSISTPLGADALLATALRGQEAVSECFDLELNLISEDPALDFSALVGKAAAVKILGSQGTPRYFHGIVTEFRQGGTDPQFTSYRARLRPRLWLLGLTSDCRIFQTMKVPEIIETVLSEHGVQDLRLQLSRSYATRDYCVQYNESALAFVSRLMEEEGICYFFEHSESAHTLVLSDDPQHHPTCPINAEADFKPQGLRGVDEDDSVVSCYLSEQVTEQRYATTDFNFTTPETSLLVTAESGEGAHEVYRYPGGYELRAEGEGRSRSRLESLTAEARRLVGESFCRGFAAGHCFTLAGHARADMNAAYMLLRLEHDVGPQGYRNSFEAIPADCAFRPRRTTPRPRIPGGQTATVVGPEGEKEVWTDSYGRVKVQFHWDREGQKDDQSSCWIRVAQATSGNAWGGLFLPRVGQEVVVSFLEGDPDRPLVTGTVYNGAHDVPYPLPAHRTRSTIKTKTFDGEGFNELRFDDKAGAEEVYVHAERDMNIEVKNDRTKAVGANETNTIKVDRTTTIEEGNETLTVSQGDRTVKVETGKEVHEVAGTREVTITGNETHTNEANFEQKVTGNHTLKVTGNLTIDVTGSITIKSAQGIAFQAATTMESKAGASMTNKAGGSLTNQAGGSLTNKAGGSMTNQAGASLTNQAGGSMTNQAGGSNTVQGAMVSISGGMIKLG